MDYAQSFFYDARASTISATVSYHGRRNIGLGIRIGKVQRWRRKVIILKARKHTHKSTVPNSGKALSQDVLQAVPGPDSGPGRLCPGQGCARPGACLSWCRDALLGDEGSMMSKR